MSGKTREFEKMLAGEIDYPVIDLSDDETPAIDTLPLVDRVVAEQREASPEVYSDEEPIPYECIECGARTARPRLCVDCYVRDKWL